MKLSDIKGERVFDVIADILPPIYRISADSSVTKLLQKRKPKKGQTTAQAGFEWIADAAQPLMKNHKDDFVSILSTIEGISREEYIENLNFSKLLNDVADLISDPLIRPLFFSKMQTSDNSSGSALENTGGQQAQ